MSWNNLFIKKISQRKIHLLGFFIWLLAALFFTYEFFLRTFVGSVAAQIIPDLGLTAEKFALLSTAYYLAYGMMQVPVGMLVDKFGVKIIMIFATLTCALATFLFAHSTDFLSAFAGRFFMGFGSSFAFVCLLVVALTWFPARYFGFFSGLSQFVGTMGPLLAGGPLIAYLAEFHLSWRTALSNIGFLGIVLAVLIVFVVRNKPRDKTGDLLFLQIPRPVGEQFLVLLRNRQAWCIALYSATVYVSMALLAAVWGTNYLESRGLSQTMAATEISVAWLGYALGCPALGFFSDLIRRRKPVLFMAASIGFVATGFILYFPEKIWMYSILFFLLGFAAAGQNVGFATIAENSDKAIHATAIGMNNGMITLFSAFIPPLVSLFIHAGSGIKLSPENFLVGLSVMPLLYIIAMLMSLAVRETYCKSQKEIIYLKPE